MLSKVLVCKNQAALIVHTIGLSIRETFNQGLQYVWKNDGLQYFLCYLCLKLSFVSGCFFFFFIKSVKCKLWSQGLQCWLLQDVCGNWLLRKPPCSDPPKKQNPVRNFIDFGIFLSSGELTVSQLNENNIIQSELDSEKLLVGTVHSPYIPTCKLLPFLVHSQL